MNATVKGYAARDVGTFGDDMIRVWKHSRKGLAPVLLIPDDGTQVVVSREEWERMERDHRAMEAIRPNLAPRFAWIFDGFDLKQGSKDAGHADPADAILGTEGGPHA